MVKINPKDNTCPEVFDAEHVYGNTYSVGLTKREYFAAAALQGLMADYYNAEGMRSIAEIAVEVADALLAELNK